MIRLKISSTNKETDMNVLELEQQIYKQVKTLQSLRLSGFCVTAHHYDTVNPILKFSVWNNEEDSFYAPVFDADLNLIDGNNYSGDIDAARAALKQYLAQEVK